ncbi:hypothetical protein KIN20_037985 [Parelaphostrongylus tenuis]|uniref:Uncharacterized protein n=1 Tax=Parelaphostrongylus tenuis TaxID=148309 RepID=A0AAD5RID2_PARTN|nr:hypothetical protein KIN20_037985 [Parelaphostrongylus tenuis]
MVTYDAFDLGMNLFRMGCTLLVVIFMKIQIEERFPIFGSLDQFLEWLEDLHSECGNAAHRDMYRGNVALQSDAFSKGERGLSCDRALVVGKFVKTLATYVELGDNHCEMKDNLYALTLPKTYHLE